MNIPPRPKFPTEADEARVQLVEGMYAVMMDDWDDIAQDWIDRHIGEERAQTWGPPDTSMNDMLDYATQASTPGLYGQQPIILGPDGSDRLLEIIDSAGVWTKQQHVQIMSVGMGDYLVRPQVDASGLISVRTVSPHRVYAVPHADDPTRPVAVWELRLRQLGANGPYVWTWDQYDIQTRGEESYRIVAASEVEADTDADREPIAIGADLTAKFLPDAPEGGYNGDAYPFRYRSTFPFIPFVWYRSEDVSQMWAYSMRKGGYLGALMTMLTATYTGQAARDATGSAVIVGNLYPLGGSVDNVGQMDQVLTLNVKPGAILYHETKPNGGSPFVKEIGPGANLQTLLQYAQAVSSRNAGRFGLAPSEVTKRSANPSSAAALAIMDEKRREFSKRIEPLYRRSDLKLIRMFAAMYNAARGTQYPERGYSIVYQQPPPSPAQREADREQQKHDLELGQTSELQIYIDSHPGISRDEAIRQLARVRADRALIDAEAQRMVDLDRLGDDITDDQIREALEEVMEARDVLTDMAESSPDAARALDGLDEAIGLLASLESGEE